MTGSAGRGPALQRPGDGGQDLARERVVPDDPREAERPDERAVRHARRRAGARPPGAEEAAEELQPAKELLGGDATDLLPAAREVARQRGEDAARPRRVAVLLGEVAVDEAREEVRVGKVLRLSVRD